MQNSNSTRRKSMEQEPINALKQIRGKIKDKCKWIKNIEVKSALESIEERVLVVENELKRRFKFVADILVEMNGNEFDDPHLNAEGIIGARVLAQNWAHRINSALRLDMIPEFSKKALDEKCRKCEEGEIEPYDCPYYGEPNGCNR